MPSVALHHVVDGPPDAPVLLLGSSLGCTGAMWEPQVADLSATWRVVRFDHRGHGRSPAPEGDYAIADLGGDVLALLDHLGVQRAHYCGLSLGGMVGMWLAIHAPQRIDRLVVCCTSAHLGPASAWDARIGEVRSTGSVAGIADAVVARWFTPGFAAAAPETIAAFRATLAAAPLAGYISACIAIRDMDLRDDLAAIAAPTLVIGGREDEATPPEHAALIAESIPGARIELLSPAAHLASVEQATAVSTLIRAHLQGDALYTGGMAVRRAVLGDAHVDRAVAATTPFNEPFQSFITRSAWGQVWARDGLDRRTRSAITLSVLTALHCHGEIPMHVRAALRHGLTPAEIAETILHTAVYAGAPAANAALAIAEQTLVEDGAIPAADVSPPPVG